MTNISTLSRFQMRLWCSLDVAFFFFQAEDGIRDLTVTGVQTCALPILPVLDPHEAGRAEATVSGHTPPERIERLVFALNERHDAGRRYAHWDAAGARVADWLRANDGTAAFATIGDPNLYSTFGYLAQTVRGLLPGVAVETVPGITAMQALAAAAGGPLAQGRGRAGPGAGTPRLGPVPDPDGGAVVGKGVPPRC